MSAQKKKEEINLLPEKGFQSSTTGRVLAWILSTFRVIVIVTEMIVMVAFLSRFWLDAQNSDLNEKIDQKQAVLAASQNFEKQFKNTQNRLKIFSDISTSQSDSGKILKNIIESLPEDVILTNVTLKQNKITVSGSTPNENSIQQLSVNLNSKDGFSNFAVTTIGTNLTNTTNLDFVIVGGSGK